MTLIGGTGESHQISKPSAFVVVDVATKGWNVLARKIVLEPTSCVLGPYGSYSSRSHEPSTWALCTVDDMEPKAQNQDSPHSAIKKVEKVIKVEKVYFETMVQHGQPHGGVNGFNLEFIQHY